MSNGINNLNNMFETSNKLNKIWLERLNSYISKIR